MKKKKKWRKWKKLFFLDDGFTFVETIAVLAIMLILTASVGISAFKYVDKAKILSAKNQILSYRMALNAFYLDCGVYPSTEQGLQALWEKPILYPIPKNWKGPYIESEVKVDPWGNDFVYKNQASEKDIVPYEIISYGADGLEGGTGNEEDLVSWKM